jgi:hypothetical protein
VTALTALTAPTVATAPTVVSAATVVRVPVARQSAALVVRARRVPVAPARPGPVATVVRVPVVRVPAVRAPAR